jgi:hypothetical protein
MNLASIVSGCGRSELDLGGMGGATVGGTGGNTIAPLPGCGTTGNCTSTRSIHSGALGGLAVADAICNAEIPGSHFYRQSCDGGRGFLGTTTPGFVELEQGNCWNCNGWTVDDSGPYSPAGNGCSTGYATVGALLPNGCAPGTGACWRICQAVDHPLICCRP